MKQEIQGQCFPLSLSQQNILNLEKTLPGTSVNNISTTVRIAGYVDFPLLQESVHRVLEHDSSMCTRLTRVDGTLMQYHVPYIREDFPVYDFSNTGKDGLENWEIAVTREPMPLEDSPLYRFVLFRDGESSGGILIKLHHIIADGWSQVAICNRIGQTYVELLEGKEVSLTLAPDYQLYVEDEQKYLTSKAFERDEAYWKEVLKESGEPSVIKTVSSAATSPVGRRLSFELPQIINHAIYSYCQEKRVAPFAVFYMALAIYFKRIGGADRFTIGVPIFNRTNFKFKQSTGMFVTTLPFYNAIHDEWSLNEFNDQLMDTWFEMLRHQRYPFSKIAELAGGDSRLFHVALSYQDSKIYESRDASVLLSGRWHYCGYQAEQLTIHLTNLWNHQQYAVDYDYLAQYFSEDEIRSLHQSLCHILNEALSEPDKPIHALSVLSMDQKETLLYTFNRTERYLEELPLYDALVKNCRYYQNRVAVICDGERVTYGAFLYKSSGFACAIAKCETRCDDLVALLLPRKAELLAAMVGSLQAGCGYLILSEELPVERIRAILAKSGAKVLITTEKGKRRVGSGELSVLTVEEIYESGDVFYIASDDRKSQEKPLSERLAYVVYTSGSTGEPKGVEITHRNLLNLAQEMKDIYGQGAVLSVCNVGFDAFMLESIVALLNGRTVVLPGDEDLESPERLAALINGHAVGFLSMTPSRLSAFMQDKAFARAMRKVDSIVCGGESFPAELLKMLNRYTNARIYNQYGPSETTVGVSIKELSHAEKITAGRPMGNCRLYVLDKWMNPLPAGGLGYLYVGGTCVGRGYRNDPELTGKYFLNNPFVVDDTIYFTGDVASWTQDGEIQIRGRMDNQVKLRGLRVELDEVSSCVKAYPGVRAAVAKICEFGGQQVLGVYYCADDEVQESGIRAHAATYLPRYMLPAFLQRLPELPMNANGKVDEKRLPMPRLGQDEDAYTLSRTAEAVLEVFCSVLGRHDLKGGSDYFLYGGNSLNAMECIMGIEERLGKKLRIADLYACRTAVSVAAYLDGEDRSVMRKEAGDRMRKAPEEDQYELSPVQQGMYVQTLLDPGKVSYNMPGAFRLEEKPDKGKLEAAFALLIREEPLLRTAYVQGPKGLCAQVQKEVAFELEELEAESYEKACQQFLCPFDLSKTPLLRAALWQSPGFEEEKGENASWYLFVDSHHIVGDGMSTPLILKRLNQAYMEGSLHTEWNYYDYLYTRRICENETEKQSQLNYWKEHLEELPEILTLPGDYKRPKRFDHRGAEYECVLPAAESEALEQFCSKQGVSGFVLFLAAYGILLKELSGREDFVIGAPVAGRTMPQAKEICGPFINTLPLRLRPDKELTTTEWLSRVQAEVTGMLDHQQVSLEEIIQALNLSRGEQNALYQVMMTQSPVNEDAFVLGDKNMQYAPIPTGSVKMDLILELARKSDAYVLRFSYATSIFGRETIPFYARCLRQILSELIRKQDVALKDLKVLTQQDYETYVERPNYEVTPFVNLPIHKLLYGKTLSMADKTAVIFHGESYTFAQLERRAAAIAGFLESRGVEPGGCIGLCLSRTPDMIAAMYGVLKARCAYVFMLPTFPAARLTYMLEVSKAQMLLYDEKAKAQMPEEFLGGALSCEAYELPKGEAEYYEDRPVGGNQLVNVLFTSGSTGKPKGVMLRHRSVSNLYTQMKKLLDPVEGRVLCSTNSVFDCFVVETLIALALGRTVVLADEEEMMLPWKLAALMETYDTGIFEMTPSRLQMCLGNEAFCQAAKHIRIVLLGGEVVTHALAERFYTYSKGVLMNMYGPTEATVFTTMGPVPAGEHITIGKPLQNTRTYVLDEAMRPVIPTACGELYIAGECLSPGYISRPELTESSFVDDLYFPGEKMYRSGDLVRQRLDGSFDYVGRKDNQVKLNGQRVELGEITGAILETEGVGLAATVPVRREDGSMELWAFYEYEGAERDPESKILAQLKKTLPVYMIPSHFCKMDQIPMTATNKIDMQTLKQMAVPSRDPAMAETTASAETEPEKKEVYLPPEPKQITVEYILSVWNRVLSAPVTDPGVSFFAQGGTSMAALNVLSFYFNDRLEMALADFYEHPTAEGQAAFLAQKYGDAQETKMAEGTREEVRTAKTVSDWTLELNASVALKKDKAVLVTGGTGYFGAHLVKALLEEHRQVLCLLRDGDRDRLEDQLSWYFGRGVVLNAKDQLEVVKGDIVKERLGMTKKAYKQLGERIGEIYHCAADVRHYAAEEESYLQTNVGGTANMLELAKASGAVFYHMSTLSVSGELLKDGRKETTLFTEQDYDIGQIWEENIYVKSKFLAEGLVWEAVREGFPARIFRLGRLVGRASDGVFQRNPGTNAFYLLMKGFGQVGAVAKSAAETLTDLMPVDVAVAEVLALRESEGLVYHIMHPTPPTLGEVLREMDEDIRLVSEETFAEILSAKAPSMDRELHAMVMNNWQIFKNARPVIETVNARTMELLKKTGADPKIPSPGQILKSFV